ncbi:hypothetical protein P170DRAFT_467979 [Aspergillus steynii IBT 23096]|uniref:DUF4604 domain-containing protein n=1 Tax=Aspergillus steynii IBT 23096 TaxID=1392250 RepID=A0A2I2FUF8_9EURO|nr:uncharacterized protein P170DRAFT_467979 [Aspergillus steynii IBT 23096]PLB44262.1 hypothetical protein P170DRAFT_467979 [Aspergillus steynii IBT 23096]
MSYNAKNLAYEAKEPAFLQKLKGQYGDTSGRLQQPISRPRRPKDDTGDDDAPTYVDEESNEVISKEEYEAMVRGGAPKEEESGEKTADRENPSGGDEDTQYKTEKDGPSSKQNLAEIGGQKKRKQAKVIGEDAPEAETEEAQPKEPAPRKSKQKKKKIKLSFDET